MQVENFRSFVDSKRVQLGPITVLIGPNNAGKSSILKALYLLQYDAIQADIRIGSQKSTVTMQLSEIQGIAPWGERGNSEHGTLTIRVTPGNARSIVLDTPSAGTSRVESLPMREPDHFVVPYFSRRKTAAYMREVNVDTTTTISADFSHLTAKLSRLGNPSFPSHDRYAETCRALLGFVVTAIPEPNGQIPGIYLPDGNTLPMDQMGEGVPNIVGLLADLAQSEGKIFLIEEPENDLHPEALKALLNLMIESSQNNQIVVSTHSNIVTRYLGATADSKLHYVSTQDKSLPTVAKVSPVEPSAKARLAALRDLGYSFSDFDLWDGWLILEESSAERIIRDYLIPWFTPKLTRIRTISTGGNSQVEPTFIDFNRLVLFTHLEEAYRDSAWVLVDGDEAGQRIVTSLREKFPSWSPDRFDLFGEEQFERYYPSEFSGQIDAVLALSGQEKHDGKKRLLDEVREWLDADDARGRVALEDSAGSVIEHLRRIQDHLLPA